MNINTLLVWVVLDYRLDYCLFLGSFNRRERNLSFFGSFNDLRIVNLVIWMGFIEAHHNIFVFYQIKMFFLLVVDIDQSIRSDFIDLKSHILDFVDIILHISKSWFLEGQMLLRFLFKEIIHLLAQLRCNILCFFLVVTDIFFNLFKNLFILSILLKNGFLGIISLNFNPVYGILIDWIDFLRLWDVCLFHGFVLLIDVS